MYKKIELIMFTQKLSKAKLAKSLGISYNTFLLKLKGKYKFSLDEAVALKDILHTELTVEELFSTATAA